MTKSNTGGDDLAVVVVQRLFLAELAVGRPEDAALKGDDAAVRKLLGDPDEEVRARPAALGLD